MPSSTVCIVASLEWISVVAACMLGMCFDRSTPKHLTEIISAGISVMSSTIRSCFFFFFWKISIRSCYHWMPYYELQLQHHWFYLFHPWRNPAALACVIQTLTLRRWVSGYGSKDFWQRHQTNICVEINSTAASDTTRWQVPEKKNSGAPVFGARMPGAILLTGNILTLGFFVWKPGTVETMPERFCALALV